MSTTLAKKALYLVDSDDDELVDRKTDKKKSSKFYSQEKSSSLKTKKKGLKLTCYGLKPDRSKLEEYRKKQQQDFTKDNLKEIKKMRSVKVKKDLATSILKEMGKISVLDSEKIIEKPNFITEDDFKKYIVKSSSKQVR